MAILKLLPSIYIKCGTFSCSLTNLSKTISSYIQQINHRKVHNSNRQNNEAETEKVYFGYEVVSPSEKTKKVHSVFSKVASKYDLMNDLMCFGTHRFMKDYLISNLGPVQGTKLLDVAGGTGDVVFRFLRAAELAREANSTNVSEDASEEPKSEVKMEDNRHHAILLDINKEMISVCKARARENNLEQEITTVLGTADALPFPDNTFDAYTVAFGIRNFTYVDKALSEARRVLRRGGRFMCLEFSEVQNPVLSKFYELYSELIPCIGQLAVRDWKSYQYLVDSIQKFSNQEDFQGQMEEAGFSLIRHTNIFSGIATIYSAYKI